jgi:apolipoprotein D and lipocalin family protein
MKALFATVSTAILMFGGMACATTAGSDFHSTPAHYKPVLPPVETVAHVDLENYIGKWYEIAMIPHYFERMCVTRTTAEYEILPDGFIKVLNSCEKADGQRQVAEGRAKVADPSNAKLKVTFVKIAGKYFFSILGIPVSGKYWIVELGPDYSYSIVADPTRDYAWILSRTPSLDMATLRHIDEVLRSQHYDTCRLLTTPQDGGLQVRKPLCQVIQ